MTPPLIDEAGLAGRFNEAVEAAEAGFWKIHEVRLPAAAPYLVTHAHRRRALVKLNARECFHLFKLRIQRQAHFTIQQVSEAALKLAVEAHPWLFRHLTLRDYPSCETTSLSRNKGRTTRMVAVSSLAAANSSGHLTTSPTH